MKWQGRTGLLVGLALVVATGLVVPGKKSDVHDETKVLSENPVASSNKPESPDAVPVSRPAREPVPVVIKP